jgi:hypothetical protein
MSLLITSNPTLNEIVNVVEQLPEEQQKILLVKLKKGELLQKIKVVNKGVKRNSISTDEIVAIVKRNRKKWKKTE